MDMTLEKAPFTTGDLVVYPTHGVGKIVGIETQEIAGHTLNVFVVHFDKDRMTLRVPLAKAKVSGLRRLSSRKEMDAALAKLRGRSRAKRTMWSRRAQEYQAKIASGDPLRSPKWYATSIAMSVSPSNLTASARFIRQHSTVLFGNSQRSSGSMRAPRPSAWNNCLLPEPRANGIRARTRS